MPLNPCPRASKYSKKTQKISPGIKLFNLALSNTDGSTDFFLIDFTDASSLLKMTDKYMKKNRAAKMQRASKSNAGALTVFQK